MYQKCYNIAIVNELLKGRNHVREIARKLKTNPMVISRRMKELLKENVVDSSKEGRNKVYFLKKSVEAKAYVMMAENYKLKELLEKYPTLRGAIEKIQKDERIKLAVLFGSYAKGLAKSGSDIDVFVETKRKEIKKSLEMTDTNLSVKIGNFDIKSILVKEIIKNHVIIKGTEEFYEKIKFFE